MPYEVAGYKFLVLLALCGLTSGVLTCALIPPSQEEAGLYCGIVFGLFLAVPLAIMEALDSRVLYSLLKALGLVTISTAAYFLAYMTSVGVQINFRQIVPSAERWDMGTAEPASPIALLVGGLVGGFFVFAGVIFLSRPEIVKGIRARRIIQVTLLGGALGITAWALRSSIGAATWNLLHTFGLTPPWELSPREWFHDKHDYGQRSRMYSLYIVWQTGVGTTMGIMFRHASLMRANESDRLGLFNSRETQ